MYGIRASWPARSGGPEGTVWMSDRDMGRYGWSEDLQSIVSIAGSGGSGYINQTSSNPIVVSYDLGLTFEEFRPSIPTAQVDRYHTGICVDRSRWIAYTSSQTFPRRGSSYSDDFGLSWTPYTGASDEIGSVTDLGNGYFTAQMAFGFPDPGRSIGWWRVPYNGTTWTQMNTSILGNNDRRTMIDDKMIVIRSIGASSPRDISRNFAASWSTYTSPAAPLVMTIVNGIAYALNGNGDIIRSLDGEPDTWEVIHEGSTLPFYDPLYPVIHSQAPTAWPSNDRYMFAYILQVSIGTGSYPRMFAINPLDPTDFHDFTHPELTQANRMDITFVTPPDPITNMSALLITNNSLAGYPNRRYRFRWLFENVPTP